MADDLGERTEEATPKKKLEARNSGQIARSQDLAAVVLLVFGTVTIAVTATWMLGQGRVVLAAVLDGAVVTDPLDPAGAWETVVYVVGAGVRTALPILLIAWGAALLSNLGQIGWLFSPKVLQPKLSKLNPLSGFQRVFGLSALVKAAIDSLKVLIVIVVAAATVYQHASDILVLPLLAATEALAAIGGLMLHLALRVLAVLLVLAILDFIYQKWKHSKDLRMSKQQVKDEMKQSEGDPEVKRRRLRMQQQIAMQRISAAVPRADVVVTNPDHISIAIKYDAESMHAPKVIAKGADHLALRIRQLALQHGIPIVERKPLARALYRDVGVGQEIPPDFYAAVAEVLAYVYQLSGRKAG
ncbi:MAG: flagellar biosynthesis protein FlhB [Phycisphaerae bacterium]|nr:flagellar biosynthesis protein FlhB [Phycisphaerae bacterium]